MERFSTLSPEELDSFLRTLTTNSTALPDQLVTHYLSRSGFATDDIRVTRLIALAAQKFLADVSNDAIAHARIRQNAAPAPKKASSMRAERLTLTVDDLERALRDYGVVLCKPPYFADSVVAGAPDPPKPAPNLVTASAPAAPTPAPPPRPPATK